jgi:hypothetical protein
LLTQAIKTTLFTPHPVYPCESLDQSIKIPFGHFQIRKFCAKMLPRVAYISHQNFLIRKHFLFLVFLKKEIYAAMLYEIAYVSHQIILINKHPYLVFLYKENLPNLHPLIAYVSHQHFLIRKHLPFLLFP